MDRSVFDELLRASAARARDLARTLVIETLPDRLRFVVHLGQSTDAHVAPGYRQYPEDRSWTRRRHLVECEPEAVVEALWRDGWMPTWVNISAIGEDGESTIVELVCCAHFTADDQRLYFGTPDRRSPFHVLGASLPQGWLPGERFSIHGRAACWGHRSFERLSTHVGEVRSLDLKGAVCDDDRLVALPVLPRLETLELEGTLRGHGLHALARQPALRSLRVELWRAGVFDLRDAAGLPPVEALTLGNLPDAPWSSHRLATLAPALATLSLAATGRLHLDGPLPAGLTSLSIDAARLRGSVAWPATLRRVQLRLAAADQPNLAGLLASMPRLDRLDLRGSPVTEPMVRELLARAPPRELELAATRVGKPTIRALAHEHPDVAMFPR